MSSEVDGKQYIATIAGQNLGVALFVVAGRDRRQAS